LKLGIGEDTCGVHNNAVFVVEVSEGHGMNFIGSSQAAVCSRSTMNKAVALNFDT
jgi:hypothetical protein